MTLKNQILPTVSAGEMASAAGKQLHSRLELRPKTSFSHILRKEQVRQSSQPNPHITEPASSNSQKFDMAEDIISKKAPNAQPRHPIYLSQHRVSLVNVRSSQGRRAYQAIKKNYPTASLHFNNTNKSDLGGISAYFESGGNGPGTIGFDPMAGTSYGTYQIASKPGTMDEFIRYLEDKAPAYAARLKKAGPANTGGKTGRMPTVWQQIAAEDPAGFERLQRDFIEQTHYLPACQAIKERTGVDIEAQPIPIQEAVFSTAVQHGPQGAANIFEKAIKNRRLYSSQAIVQTVYAERMKRFYSSPPEIRRAVASRLAQERSMIMAALRQGQYIAGRAHLFETPG